MKLFNNVDIRFGDPPIPPLWVIQKSNFFGSYLAGVIDGDGDIRVKRKKYPQCVIRISSGHKQIELANAIQGSLSCSTNITRRESNENINGRSFHGTRYNLGFYVSSKNFIFVKEFILPRLTINHKKERLENYINLRWPQWRSQS